MKIKFSYKKAQTLLEYLLIAALFAAVIGTLLMKIDYRIIKNYMFGRPASDGGTSIKIEAMTEK